MQQNPGHLFMNGVVSIVSAHVGHNPIAPGDVPNFMKDVSKALVECVVDATRMLGDPGAAAQNRLAIPQQERAAIAAPVPAPPQESAAPAPVSRVDAPAASVPETAVAEAPATEAPTAEATVASDTTAEASGSDATSEKPKAPKRERTIYHKFPNLPRKPAVNVGDSIQTDGVVCLFDGEKRKMLSRHLLAKFSMTPEQYREYWKLPADYPMTAPGYAQEKRIVAVAQGLGTPKLYENAKGASQAKPAAPAAAKSPARRQGARQTA